MSVAVIMGSKSDLPCMQDAIRQLDELAIPHHVEIVSAHRTPEAMVDFAKQAHTRFKVVIAGAGGAAHLPGMVASLTILPVIGVPVLSSRLSGLDSLLSIVQMPRGVPVATVAIDNARNAALLAARILAVSDSALADRLRVHQRQMRAMVEDDNQALADGTLP